ncbi:hypothetical protein HDU81_001171, partial [Chytriomyces hyalinus]
MQILLSLALLAITANAVCTKITVRREWGQLSASEKNAYIAAVKKITARPMSNQYKDPTKMSTDDFSSTHAANAHWAHANAEFLVFHRAMLRLYEKALESAGWTGGLIYLDEGAVPTTWSKLDLFSKDYFGSLTRTQQCLTDGQFSKASGFMDLGDNGRSCVTRCGSGTMWSAKYIATNVLSTATTYEQLRGDDTANYHGTGHMVMGGNCDMGNPLWSPRDPLFYLHHTYVDKIYWKWQQLCPSYVTDYEGNLSAGKNPNPLLGNSRPVSSTLPLDSWVGLTAATKITVRREWGQLSATEKNAYIAAVKKITARPMSNQYKDPTKMSTDDFSSTHAANAHWAHANAEFLVFHRAMLRLYEKALESAGWNGGLIYLDEGAVPTTWNKLDLFSKDYFGSLTRTQQCLTDGQFSKASGFMDLGDNGRSCVTRCGSGTMWSAKYIATNVLSTSTTYEQLRGDDTANYHGTGHMVMGGNCDMGNPLWSPRDPLFYLHHTYVDKIYWKWQQLCPSYVTDYEGNLSAGKNPNPLLGNSRPVSSTLPLDSW